MFIGSYILIFDAAGFKIRQNIIERDKEHEVSTPHSPCSQQTDGLRSSLLAFKTKWRKKGQNTSAQGNALGINTLPTIAQNGQKNYPVYLPFASAVVVGCHSFATFGATI